MPTAVRHLLRPLAPRDPDESHRVASPLELLTDLCFVVAVAQAAAELHHAVTEDHAAAGLLGFAMAFFAIFWGWLNFVWFASAYDNDDVGYRLLTILQILGVLVVAAGVPGIFEGHFTVAVVGYVIMRVALVLQWLRASRNDPVRAITCRRYAVGIIVVQLGWVAFLFVPHGLQLALFLVLVVADCCVPVFAERPAETPWHPHHIAERYGLFFIIVLGETILSTTLAIRSAAGEHVIDLAALAVVVGGGILIVFGVWWLYFSRSAAAVLQRARRERTGGQYAWGFGHYLVLGSAAAVGAGLAARVDYWSHTGHAPALTTAAAVTVPVAILLVTVWFIQIRRHDPSPRAALPVVLATAVVIAATFTPVPELVCGLAVAGLVAAEIWLTGLGTQDQTAGLEEHR